MRPADVARRGAAYLERHGMEPDRAQAEAEALLRSVLGVDRTTLFLREAGLTSPEARSYGRALCRRCTGTPMQHLTREQGFRRLVLEVRPGVFIPRPETEVVVEVALARTTRPDPLVVDLGTGTGAIALAIADERPDAQVFATDRSADAIALAEANAERLGLSIHVVQGDLFDGVPRQLRGAVDLVVSNPPYVPSDRELPVDVRADPPDALFGGRDVYERIAKESRQWLRPGGRLVVEIDDEAASIADVLARAGFHEVEVTPDLAGRDRVVDGAAPLATRSPRRSRPPAEVP